MAWASSVAHSNAMSDARSADQHSGAYAPLVFCTRDHQIPTVRKPQEKAPPFPVLTVTPLVLGVCHWTYTEISDLWGKKVTYSDSWIDIKFSFIFYSALLLINCSYFFHRSVLHAFSRSHQTTADIDWVLTRETMCYALVTRSNLL